MIGVNYWKPTIWPLADEFNIGHCSLSLGLKAQVTISDTTSREDYASWWPVTISAADLPELLTIGVSPRPHSYDEDLIEEGRSPDDVIFIDGLDEAAIRAAWKYYKQNLRYAFLLENCATTSRICCMPVAAR